MNASTSLATEERLFALAMASERGCVLPPIQSAFTPNGAVIVTRDGLRVRLHRHMWERFFGLKLRPGDRLIRVCSSWGCVHPAHYTRSNKPYQSREKCRNGHEYTEGDVMLDGSRVCGVCLAARRERQRRGGDPNWAREKRRKFCPYGHPYDEENTYTYPTKSGFRRKCRACALLRAAGTDPATTV